MSSLQIPCFIIANSLLYLDDLIVAFNVVAYLELSQ